jgi:hypothetical protein
MLCGWHTDLVFSSSCLGRETQERQERQGTSHSPGKLEEETTPEWDLVGEWVWKWEWEWHELHEISWCMSRWRWGKSVYEDDDYILPYKHLTLYYSELMEGSHTHLCAR